MTDEQQQQRLSALLRLKRFEQPPAGYYQKLLNDVHRRQRAELLRRPLWKIALERVHTFFSEHSLGGLGNLSYAGATGAALVAVLAVVGLSLPSGSGRAGKSGIAAATAAPSNPATLVADAAPARVAPVDLRADGASTPRLLSLQGNAPLVVSLPLSGDEPVQNARLFPVRSSDTTVVVKQPRYIIDSRPASSTATAVSYQF